MEGVYFSYFIIIFLLLFDAQKVHSSDQRRVKGTWGRRRSYPGRGEGGKKKGACRKYRGGAGGRGVLVFWACEGKGKWLKKVQDGKEFVRGIQVETGRYPGNQVVTKS